MGHFIHPISFLLVHQISNDGVFALFIHKPLLWKGQKMESGKELSSSQTVGLGR